MFFCLSFWKSSRVWPRVRFVFDRQILLNVKQVILAELIGDYLQISLELELSASSWRPTKKFESYIWATRFLAKEKQIYFEHMRRYSSDFGSIHTDQSRTLVSKLSLECTNDNRVDKTQWQMTLDILQWLKMHIRVQKHRTAICLSSIVKTWIAFYLTWIDLNNLNFSSVGSEISFRCNPTFFQILPLLLFLIVWLKCYFVISSFLCSIDKPFTLHSWRTDTKALQVDRVFFYTDE